MSENSNTKTSNQQVTKNRIAIILLNFGGPSGLDKIKPFLFSLFYDKAIINLPNPLRFLIAKIIAIIRNKKSKKIYSLIGNRSPILEETEAQKLALTTKLKQNLADNFKIFIAMRHSHPKSKEIVKQIKQYSPSEIILLPLYPQFSSTTTGSFIQDFILSFDTDKNKHILPVPIKTICCYPFHSDFIKSHILLIKQSLTKLADKLLTTTEIEPYKKSNFRILFSAHNLPVKIIKSGDPYQWQIEQTVKKITEGLNINNLDYRITYQSRIGSLEWLKPNTKDEIEIVGKENKSLIIVPIAFTSEHVETLVELDIEYREIANKYKIQYIRVPALRINEIFIDSLTKILLNSINHQNNQTIKNLIMSASNERICPVSFTMCPSI